MQNLETIMKELIDTFPKIESKPPTDTIAHIFGREYRENFISDWLAYLLFPEKTGTAGVLNSLFKLANCDFCFDLETQVNISREHTFNDERRIDFLIETEDLVVGIENKIWSDLEATQLEDYSIELENCAKNKKVIKILLYPFKNNGQYITKATNDSKELYGFIPITYERFIGELKNITIDSTSNLRASFMLQDFITHMEEYIMVNNSETGTLDFETIAFANRNKEQIQKINEQVDISIEQFKKYVEGRIAEKVGEGWEQNSPSSGTYFQVYKSDSGIGWGSAIHFELISKDFFPPAKMQVVLHTREQKNHTRTEELINLQDKVKEYLINRYCSDIVDIDYKTEETFINSFDQIMEMLKDIIDVFTQKVDNELNKVPIKQQ